MTSRQRSLSYGCRTPRAQNDQTTQRFAQGRTLMIEHPQQCVSFGAVALL